jgi:hypothetical protein
VLILDPSACVNIDECKYCYFFIGLCEASVFIRDCVRCVVVVLYPAVQDEGLSAV